MLEVMRQSPREDLARGSGFSMDTEMRKPSTGKRWSVKRGSRRLWVGMGFAGFRTGGAVFDHAGKLIRRFRGDNGEGHHANFLWALRSRKTSDLRAPILEGHVWFGTGR